jgi:hypothetical protein
VLTLAPPGTPIRLVRVLKNGAVETDKYAQRQVVRARLTEGQGHLLVRATADDPVSLEELALDYLREPGTSALPAPPRTTDTETTG